MKEMNGKQLIRPRKEFYQWLVMAFGLKNGPRTFTVVEELSTEALIR